MQRNTEALLTQLAPLVAADADGSLAGLGVAPAQAQADLARLGELIHTRHPADERVLAQLHARYQGAAPPAPKQAWSVAYRLRMLFLDRWNLWRRLTRYRRWVSADGQGVRPR